MDEMLLLGKQILAMQPFSVLIGAELTGFSEGSAELKIPIREELKQQHGFVHGGVISYAADNALTYAGGSVLGPSVVTSEFKINYLRPVVEGKVTARAHLLLVGARLAWRGRARHGRQCFHPGAYVALGNRQDVPPAASRNAHRGSPSAAIRHDHESQRHCPVLWIHGSKPLYPRLQGCRQPHPRQVPLPAES